MREVLAMLSLAAASAAIVGLAGASAHYFLRGRSIALHIYLLLAVTVFAMLAGVVAVAQAMFISEHDLQVLLIVLASAATVSLVLGGWLGRRLGADAMWAVELRARERQMEANRRELMAWVSHDLRTPLAGMRAMAEALEDGVVSDPETVADYHRRIRVETDRMAGLVDDLFELSRINAGALRLNLANVALGDVVSDVVASAAPIAAAKRVELVAVPGGWPTVRGSEPELARILGNLLRNAVRHTPGGGRVEVTGGFVPAERAAGVRAVQGRAVQGRAEDGYGWFAVTDGCGGIPEADLPRVFEPAFRGEAARTPGSDPSGGLGLSIVRGLAQAHAGEVTVRNVPGGCRFEVRLPAVATA
jgi:signal transduction histidine kinase